MNKKVLLIEDDQIFGNIYRNKLLLEGFEVEIAFDGEAGVEKVRAFRPDAVLLDLMLPKLPGVEVIKKIRSEPDFLELPILVFTNMYLTSMVHDAWKAGATKCLAKAKCTPKQVIGTLRTILLGDGTQKPPAAAAAVPAPGPAAGVAAPAAGVSAPASAGSAAESPGEWSEEPHGSIDRDEEFQGDLQKSFLEGLPATLTALRGLLQGLIKAENEAARLQQLQQLYNRIRSIASNAGIVGMGQLAHISDALEALLKELHEKPANINASTLRTVASAVDFIGILSEQTGAAPAKEPSAANVLVVDDEAISRRAVIYALEKAKLKPVSVEDPLQALQLLSQDKFDLILLDVHMPAMSGFELCSKLRTLPAYKKTPVVFVTRLNDFESRASSSMSGGNDFIAKPFLFIELAVKALVHVLRGQLESAKTGPPEQEAAAG